MNATPCSRRSPSPSCSPSWVPSRSASHSGRRRAGRHPGRHGRPSAGRHLDRRSGTRQPGQRAVARHLLLRWDRDRPRGRLRRILGAHRSAHGGVHPERHPRGWVRGYIAIRGPIEVEEATDMINGPYTVTIVGADGTVQATVEGTGRSTRLPAESGEPGMPLAGFPTWEPAPPPDATPTDVAHETSDQAMGRDTSRPIVLSRKRPVSRRTVPLSQGETSPVVRGPEHGRDGVTTGPRPRPQAEATRRGRSPASSRRDRRRPH